MLPTEKIAKYQRFSKVLRVITNISFWALLFAVILMLVLAIITLLGMIQPFDYMDNMSISPDGVLRFKLGELSPSQSQSVAATILFALASLGCVYGALLYFLSGILRSVEKGSPFVKENALRISIMGYILLGGSVIVGLAYSITAFTLFEALNITDVSVNFQLNSTMFASGLLLLILAGIFRYGSYLQEEYDSTL